MKLGASVAMPLRSKVAIVSRSRGFTYSETFELAQALTGIELAEWDALLYYLDGPY